jgi:putative flippase GtrA
MSPLKRFLRFNLVGLLGVVTQLTTLFLLNHVFPRHYLLTSTTFAVEFTLLHNFVWHLHYTWPETSEHPTRDTLTQLLRFHLSNGLVSLLGNIALMHVFVREARLPVLFANALTIACCGLANFLLAHHWVFPRTTQSHSLIAARTDS